MDCFEIKDLNFCYPGRSEKALSDIDLTIGKGEFVTICGRSGCGKTTLLRLLKPVLSPAGELSGDIMFEGKLLSEYSPDMQAWKIGFVMQNPDNGIVTDKVWHELAFGLENLGIESNEIRTRVSEMASYFGIQTWFHKSVDELSGGQKQMLNLASVMVMQPSVLILDEPASQLDPIAASEFFATVKKINSELGTTVILTEHRLEDVLPLSDRVIVMDSGRIIVNDTPEKAGEILSAKKHDMYRAMPVPMRIFAQTECEPPCPLTVRDGKAMLERFASKNELHPELIPSLPSEDTNKEAVLRMKDVWFRYDKNLPDIVKGLDMTVYKGEIYAIVGGNGTGKSTALSLITGINKPYRGEVIVKGKKLSRLMGGYSSDIAAMPQDPQSLFVKKTVFLDLIDMLSDSKLTDSEKQEALFRVASLCRITSLLDFHPYDLSGGEQQRAALAKVLLADSEILILDEPTKGMDAKFKEEFASILQYLKKRDITIIMVSHDIEFCAANADRCAMFFDGSITSQGMAREFFKGKNFYTTSANRMARTLLPDAVLAEDVIAAMNGRPVIKDTDDIQPDIIVRPEHNKTKSDQRQKLSKARLLWGIGSIVLFAVCIMLYLISPDSLLPRGNDILCVMLVVFAVSALSALFPDKKGREVPLLTPKRKLTKRTLIAALMILVTIPLTIWLGIQHFGDRKYYFISLLIILETMLPFFMVFEGRRPKARELVTVSALCALAVAGRAAFFMLPQFKPVVAVVIISGICLGGETGFLVGAMTGFVSNFFFGQGPWTPWQMFAFGIIGFISGILFGRGLFRRNRAVLALFGFLATFILYGGIMNVSYVFQAQAHPTWEMFAASFITGFPFDMMHSISTALFLWFISGAMIEKIERVIVKYGILNE